MAAPHATQAIMQLIASTDVSCPNAEVALARLSAQLLPVVLLTCLLTACAGSGNGSPHPAGKCRTALAAGPTCEVLWGTAVGSTPTSTLEQSIERPFDIIYYFHGIDIGRLPTPAEQSAATGGRILHIDLESRQFLSTGHPEVTWKEVSAGTFDATLRQTAAGLAAFDRPFFITFDHEADSPHKLRARGTPAQFIAAWRHVRKIFLAAGAKQAIWTWVVTGYPANFVNAAALYPGNAFVDWISWDPYDQRGCAAQGVSTAPAKSFAAVAQPFYRWLATVGAKAGISLDKPYMISETGSAYDPRHPDASAAFIRSIPSGLAQLPRIRAVVLWSESAGACDYRITGVPGLDSALRSTAAALRRSRM